MAPLIIPKTTDSVCQNNSGWVAKIIYQDTSSGGGGGGSGGGLSINQPASQYIYQSVVDSCQYHRNDQDRIDAIGAELAAFYAAGGWSSGHWAYSSGYGYYYSQTYYNADGSKNDQIAHDTVILSVLMPARTYCTYKLVQVPNPLYNPEQVPPTSAKTDTVALNDKNRYTKWSYSTYELTSHKPDGTYHSIPVSNPIASCEFVYCGCGSCECACFSGGCVNLSAIAQTILNSYQAPLI